jgi:hypothetical protein
MRTTGHERTMAYVGFRDPKNTVRSPRWQWRIRANAFTENRVMANGSLFLSAFASGVFGIVRADPCDPFWKFARLSGAVLDKTAWQGMLPTVAPTRICL